MRPIIALLFAALLTAATIQLSCQEPQPKANPVPSQGALSPQVPGQAPHLPGAADLGGTPTRQLYSGATQSSTPITGRLRDQSGQALANQTFFAQAALRLLPSEGFPANASVPLSGTGFQAEFTTDASGDFTVHGELAHAGAVTSRFGDGQVIALLRIGVSLVTIDSGILFTTDLAAPAPNQIDFATLTLPKSDTWLAGQVVDINGTPVVAASVTLVSDIGGAKDTKTFTNKQGRFRVEGFTEAARFRVHVSRQHFASQDFGPFTRGSDRVNLLLRKSGSVLAKPIDDERLPPMAWTMLLLRAGTPAPRSSDGPDEITDSQASLTPPFALWAKQDANGFRWDQLAHGLYDIHIYSARFKLRVRTIANVQVADGAARDPRLINLNPLAGNPLITIRVNREGLSGSQRIRVLQRPHDQPSAPFESLARMYRDTLTIPKFQPAFDLAFRTNGRQEHIEIDVVNDLDIHL